ncbi:Crp/Fnr family transcriptional regulator [Nodosilinea sp. LEGE 07298]|jgi:CRP-like cAMP-binding protein|uniref:Crp/Fnr family transcriptional regulator n=1 Tax=Nodosilinea sp. LEGE 07298 TaxID=2777970 RepID=UPI00187F1978|nr:Crp/Fnr family transcriptional regulator [Nodosilinea sp. LEGE 07298]MBE9112521.1 Crp/Fnr family transcriptional regulator [Nodosilinea sp. LEGE 07298]
MLRPQLSILQSFGPKSSLPPLGDRVWLIEQGIVRALTWTSEGQVTTVGIWGQGDIVGLPLTRLMPYQMECLTSVTVTEVAFESQTRFWQQLLLNHLCYSQELFCVVQIPCLAERLLQLLHWLAHRFGYQTPEGTVLPPLLTHKQLSEVLGSSRVTVTRLLNSLEQQGQLMRFRKRRGENLPSCAMPGSSRAILLPQLKRLSQSV